MTGILSFEEKTRIIGAVYGPDDENPNEPDAACNALFELFASMLRERGVVPASAPEPVTTESALEAMRPIMESLDAIRQACEDQQMAFAPVAQEIATRSSQTKNGPLREYRDALAANQSAQHWVGSKAFVRDINEWIEQVGGV